MRELIGITGTPGTGKKTIAPRVGGALGFETLDLNYLATEYQCVERRGEALLVDTVRLRGLLKKRRWNRVIFYGHLLPDLFRKGELSGVFVLRCQPSVLKRRLLGRGYKGEHLRENVVAELIGVSLSASIRSFGAGIIKEYDTTKSENERLSEKIVSDYLSRAKPAKAFIDWVKRYDSAAKLTSLLSTSRTESALT